MLFDCEPFCSTGPLPWLRLFLMNVGPCSRISEPFASGFLPSRSLVSLAVSGCENRALSCGGPSALVFVISFASDSGEVPPLLSVAVRVVCRVCRLRLFLCYGTMCLLCGNRACQLCFRPSLLPWMHNRLFVEAWTMLLTWGIARSFRHRNCVRMQMAPMLRGSMTVTECCPLPLGGAEQVDIAVAELLPLARCGGVPNRNLLCLTNCVALIGRRQRCLSS